MIKTKKGLALSLPKGFTLIELLVVISIIGILAGLTLTGFSAARKNARDTERKSDLGQYRVALEAYSSSNNSKYPLDAYNGDSYSASGIFATGPIIAAYLPAIINDPATSATSRYIYYGSADGLTYKLMAGLETGGYWIICSSGKAGKSSTYTTDSVCNLP